MIWFVTACAALFDNGLIDQTCENISACDSAEVEETGLNHDSGDAEVVDVGCDAAIPLDGRVLLPQPC